MGMTEFFISFSIADDALNACEGQCHTPSALPAILLDGLAYTYHSTYTFILH